MKENNEEELVEIVNENGDSTGLIMKKSEAHKKNLLHKGIAVLIINNQKQILLQKRSANRKFNPNQWELCGGHVHAHETLKDAARREIKEEIGLEIPEAKLIPLLNKERTIEKGISHLFYFYYVKCNKEEKEFIIQKEELSEVKWFDINKVIELIKSKDESTVFNENRLHLFEALKNVS